MAQSEHHIYTCLQNINLNSGYVQRHGWIEGFILTQSVDVVNEERIKQLVEEKHQLQQKYVGSY